MQNQSRIVVENVAPQLNGGAVFIKRVVDEIVTVTADVLVDGHDVIQASLLYKHESEKKWSETRMNPTFNDEFSASFQTSKQGFYSYKVQGWVDYALNWQHGIQRKIDDYQHVNSELLEGAVIVESLLNKVSEDDKNYLLHLIYIFKNPESYNEAIKEAVSERLHNLFKNNPEKKLPFTSQDFQVYVDRKKARFSTWYEFFPRSASEHEGVHGTFNDCHRLLPRVAQMGFDTLYFPPIHPIGEVNRKGKNNTTVAQEGDVGSAWGIGSRFGGHKDIHPQLGSVEDFKNLIPAVLRGTGLGSVLGILPGGGAVMAAFAAYTLEKKTKLKPGEVPFGQGNIRGVGAPEAANNAASQTSFIPLLTLGIPPNAVMALMVGAMTIHNIQPGPQVMTSNPELFWGLIASMWIGNAMLIVLNLPLIGLWIKLLSVPYRWLFPAIVLFCAIGVYSTNNNTFDIWMVGLFGLIGYIFIKLGCEPAPLLLGFVLGPMMEEHLVRALAKSRGDWSVFFTRGLSLSLLLISLALVLIVFLPSIKKKREEAFVED